MINHVVFVKFKPEVDDADIKDLEKSLEDLPNKITEIHTYEFGRDLVRSDRSYDFAVVSLFANLQTLEQYHNHPHHLKVVEKIRNLSSDIITVDFEGSDAGSTAVERPFWDASPVRKA